MDTAAKRTFDLRSFIAQGWTTMFIIFVGNLTVDMGRCQILDSCTDWANHIGPGGIVFIAVIMSVYAVMPMLIRGIRARWFRYPVVGISTMITLFYIAHEISHMFPESKPFGLSHALDVTHHLVGISVIIASILWVREKRPEPATQTGAMPHLSVGNS